VLKNTLKNSDDKTGCVIKRKNQRGTHEIPGRLKIKPVCAEWGEYSTDTRGTDEKNTHTHMQ
jgi:hypothetical protein